MLLHNITDCNHASKLSYCSFLLTFVIFCGFFIWLFSTITNLGYFYEKIIAL